MIKTMSFRFLMPLYGVLMMSSSLCSVDICENMHKIADDELKQAFNISDSEWMRYQKEIVDTRKSLSKKRTNYKHDAKIPRSMLNRIYALLKKYGIEPTSIDIHPLCSCFDAKAAVDNKNTFGEHAQPVLFLNVYKLQSNDFFDFIIAHEIRHLLNCHFLEPIKYLYHDGRMPKSSEMQLARNHWRKTHEYVADLFIASSDIDILMQGLRLYQQEYADLKDTSGTDNSDYPNSKERYVNFVKNLIEPRKELQHLLRSDQRFL